MNFVVELLDKKKHNIKNFDCGQNEMNDFLKRFAFKNQNLSISKSWVLCDEKNTDSKKNIIGYFTLSNQSIEPKLIDTEDRLPNYPLPITLLARIAIDKNFQNQGLGRQLLFLALKKALVLTKIGIPSYAVVLEVLNENVLSFYQNFKFLKPIKGSNNVFYIPMKDIEIIANNY